MTPKYDRDGITFQYPDNWELDEDPPKGFPRTISLTAKDGAFWSAAFYLKDQPLKELQHQYVEAIEGEYEGVEIDDVEFELVDETILATDFQFYCLDFLVHSRLIVTEIGPYHALITWQAEDRDFDQLEQVFKAITFSVLHDVAAA